ncbi:MAG: hypothetical protein ABI604_16010 [Nitrospirota bacterium]
MRKIFPILLIRVLGIAGVSLALIAAFSLIAISSASGGVTEESASNAATQLPNEKQTALALYVTAKEGYEAVEGREKPPSGTAPFCLVTPQGTKCIYKDAPTCHMAASINTPAYANKVRCVANPDR